MGNTVGDYHVDADDVLGEGGFGKVYVGRHVKTNEKVAVKQCVLRSDDHGAIAMQEIKLFQAITPHKHVVKMKDYNFAMRSFWVVMEFCDLGDLEDYMKKYRPSVEHQIKIMHQCASAVHHLHTLENPIIHRDLKPQNILFKRENGSDVAKLTDFGISKITEADAMHHTVAGTQLFMPPEMLAMKPYDFSADTYGLGLVYLAMIIYKPSDENMIPISDTAIRSGKIVPLGVEMVQAKMAGEADPVVVTDDPRDGAKLKAVKVLVRQMTSYEPSQRKPMKDVLTTIEDIDGGRIEGSRGKSASRRSLFTSNLPAQQTALGASSGRSGGGAALLTACAEEEEEEDSDSDSEGGSTGSGADTGYRLLRGLIEGHLREKEEEKEREEAALEAAANAMALLPLMALLHLVETDDNPAKDFDIGDRVMMMKDLVKAKELQEGHGGWNETMSRYLEEEGVVKERCNGNKDLRVQFSDGKMLVLNAQVVEKVDPSGGRKVGRLASADCKFKLMDLVKINCEEQRLRKLQKGHGGYNHKMSKSIGVKGIVKLILDKGDVYVEFFNGDKWSINPEAMELVDMTGEKIEAGDLVAVIDDKVKVIDLQENCGGWNSQMAPCLGQTGVVKRVGINDRAIVEIGGGKAWCWSVQALRLLAKGEEMVRIILQRKAEEED